MQAPGDLASFRLNQGEAAGSDTFARNTRSMPGAPRGGPSPQRAAAMKRWLADKIAFQRDPLVFLLARGCAAREALVPLSLGPGPVMLVADPALIEPIMSAPESEIGRAKPARRIGALAARSASAPSGEALFERRAAVRRQFATGLASAYVPQIAALARQQAAILARAEAFDAHEVTSRLTLRVICQILFGPSVLGTADESILVDAVRLVENDLAADQFRTLPPLPWVGRRRKAEARHGRAVVMHVVERAKARAADASVLRALEPMALPPEDLADEVLLLLLAGHHTTAAAAAWLLYHLARDPATARRIALEAATASDRAGELVAERLPQASVSLAFVREVLRLYPSTWWLWREVRQPIALAGCELKRGTSLLISPWHMHRDPRFWQAPERFRLDRAFQGPAYLPFGSGPHVCLGMGVGLLELQILALEFSAAYELRALDARVGGPKPSLVLIPPPLRLSLRPRGLSPLDAGAQHIAGSVR